MAFSPSGVTRREPRVTATYRGFSGGDVPRGVACSRPRRGRKDIHIRQIEMNKLNFESKITIEQAYLTMFEYLKRYWEETGNPDEIGGLLGELSLWRSTEGKSPIDSAVFHRWLNCAKKVITDENSGNGYCDGDIKLSK